jgi:hypothetical protein
MEFPHEVRAPCRNNLPIFESSRSHSDTPHPVRLLRTSDQPETETSADNTQHSQERDFSASGGIHETAWPLGSALEFVIQLNLLLTG